MADQAQAIHAIQQLAAQDPEIQKLQAQAQFKSVIHGHTDRCWEKCNLGKEATQSSLCKSSKKSRFFLLLSQLVAPNPALTTASETFSPVKAP